MFEHYDMDVIKISAKYMSEKSINISYCRKHRLYWVSDCPECIAESAEQDLLREIRDKWASEQAGGRPVMALRLDDWIELCKEKGLGNEDWWELKQDNGK